MKRRIQRGPGRGQQGVTLIIALIMLMVIGLASEIGRAHV